MSNNTEQLPTPRKNKHISCICPTCLERDKKALPYRCQHCKARDFLVGTTTPEGVELVKKMKESGKKLSAAGVAMRVGSDRVHWANRSNGKPPKEKDENK